MRASILDEFHFEEDTHEYSVAGTRVASVTQVIKDNGLIDYSHVPQQLLDRKRWIGQQVHFAVELYEKSQLDESSIPPECAGYFSAYLWFVKQTGFVADPTMIERALVCSLGGVRYGMKADLPGRIESHPWLIELKCTASAHPSWGIQLAGYEMGLPIPTPYRNWKLAAVQLMPNGKAKIHRVEEYDAATNRQIFQAALAVTNWKMNHGLVRAL